MVSLHDIPVFTVKLIPIPTPHKEAETLRVRLRCVCDINQTQRRTSSLRYCIKVCVQSINTCSRFSIFLFTVSYSPRIKARVPDRSGTFLFHGSLLREQAWFSRKSSTVGAFTMVNQPLPCLNLHKNNFVGP